MVCPLGWRPIVGHVRPMAALPTGTVRFFLTHIEESTRLLERQPEAVRRGLMRHDELIESAVDEHDDQVVRPRGEGDSRFAAFARATDTLSATAAVQSALHAEVPLLRARMLHTGE